jgi:hypothetical protein
MIGLLLPLEELNLFFVLLCSCARVERAQVPALPRFGILLFGIQAILP